MISWFRILRNLPTPRALYSTIDEVSRKACNSSLRGHAGPLPIDHSLRDYPNLLQITHCPVIPIRFQYVIAWSYPPVSNHSLRDHSDSLSITHWSLVISIRFLTLIAQLSLATLCDICAAQVSFQSLNARSSLPLRIAH